MRLCTKTAHPEKCRKEGLRFWLVTLLRSTRFFSISPVVVFERQLSCDPVSLDDPSTPHSALSLPEPTPKIGVYTLLDKLRECSKARDLRSGRLIHASAIQSGEASNLYVANCLIHMYAKCGSLVDAKNVFDSMDERDVVSWNSLLLGYAERGEGGVVLELFASIRTTTSCVPNARTFMAALMACSSMAEREEGKKVDGQFLKERALALGREIHFQTVQSGCRSDIFLASTVVDMYASCGSLEEAYSYLVRMPRHNWICWTSLMMGCAENGQPELALELYSTMRQSNRLTARMIMAALKACTKLALKEEGTTREDGKVTKLESLRRGSSIHRQALKLGLDSSIFVKSSLLVMYAKCGSTAEARKIFDRMPRHDLVSWTGMLLALAENGEEEEALDFFEEAGSQMPDAVACVAAIKACMRLASREESQLVNRRRIKVVSLERCRALHSQAARSRCEGDMSVAITLIDLYSKCGSVEEARRIFDRMLLKTVALWNSLMLCYVENGEPQLALEAFLFLRPDNSSPNTHSLVAVIKACASLAVAEEHSNDTRLNEKVAKLKFSSLEKGMIVHSKAVGYGCDRELFVAAALVDMYGKCGSLVDARAVFDKSSAWNDVAWNGLLFCCVENGESELALDLVSAMQSHGLDPDALSFVAALKACASQAKSTEKNSNEQQRDSIVAKSLERGIQIHSEAAKSGFLSDLKVANTVMDMYAKCGSMIEARRVFDSMAFHSVVSWSTLMLGYADNRQEQTALQIFHRMRSECRGSDPDALCYVAALKASGASASEHTVRELHSEICRSDPLDNTPSLVASLVDAYGKCGDAARAQRVFDSWPAAADLVTWTALLSAWSRGGDAQLVIELFHAMLDAGIAPSGATMTSVLAACSHTGMVERGKRYFRDMSSRFEIDPEVEHWACVVDMLGRANEVELAMEIVAETIKEAKGGETVKEMTEAEKKKVETIKATKESEMKELKTLKATKETETNEMKAINATRKEVKTKEMEGVETIKDTKELETKEIREAASGKHRIMWKSVLGACRKWNKVEAGRAAYESLVESNGGHDSAAYVLMSSIYEESGGVDGNRGLGSQNPGD